MKLLPSIRFALLTVLMFLAGTAPRVSAQQLPSQVSREPARTSPVWVQNAIIYEINPRTFSAEGNFNGITARLDYLKDLGVTVLWLMPIHPIGVLKRKGTLGAPYSIRDYYAINPDYGSEDDLRHLVTEAHRRGLKVIIDAVMDHTAWDSTMMKRPDFYRRDRSGQIVSPFDWTDCAPLDFTNPQVRAYMIDVLKYWLRQFDLDGFRCDAAEEVPRDFWVQARAEIDKDKPGVLLLGESSQPDLLVSAFDLDYAGSFYAALGDVLEGGMPATAFQATWQGERATFPRGSIHLRFTENHDSDPAVARFGMRGALAAAAIVFTSDGVPLVYNGREVGDTTESGAPALFEKLPVFWSVTVRRPSYLRFYKEVIALRRAHPALSQGETEWLHNSDEARVVTYLRKAGDEEFLVAINLSNRTFAGTVEVANGASFNEVSPDIEDSTNHKPHSSTQGLPALALQSWGFRIFRRSVH